MMRSFLFRNLTRPLRRFARREDGNAVVEFVFVIPVLMMLFMASMESGLYMIKQTTMERALDLVMREFRLGRLGAIDHDDLRDLICDTSSMLPECHAKLKVWIEPINTSSWTAPPNLANCSDNNGSLTPPSTGNVQHGASNEIMVVRVCMLQRPIFPSTGIGLRLRADRASGSYQLSAMTVVVNEPRAF